MTASTTISWSSISLSACVGLQCLKKFLLLKRSNRFWNMDASHTSSTQRHRRSKQSSTGSQWARLVSPIQCPKKFKIRSQCPSLFKSYDVELSPWKGFCRTLWCHRGVDLWPLGYKMSSHHYFILFITKKVGWVGGWCSPVCNFAELSESSKQLWKHLKMWKFDFWSKTFLCGRTDLDLKPQNCDKFILESEWIFVPN